MNIRIESLHFEATDELKSYITGKIGKLEKLCHPSDNCNVILKLDHSDTRHNKIVEVIFNIPKHRFFSKEQDETFEAAATHAIEHMRSQLVSHREKLSGHKTAPDQATDQQNEEEFRRFGNS
ncbi:MAG: ribosome hibernation-promoting factor, HPF/YfiA family [Bacteroidia bacterium]